MIQTSKCSEKLTVLDTQWWWRPSCDSWEHDLMTTAKIASDGGSGDDKVLPKIADAGFVDCSK